MGLCAAGAAVIAYDRATAPSGSVPDTASASVAAQPAPESAPKSAAAQPTGMAPAGSGTLASAGLEVAGPTLALRLRDLAGAKRDAPAAGAPQAGADLRDAFRPSDAWLAHAPKASAPEDPDKAKAGEFLRRHALQAVLVSGEKRQAVIDFKCLNVGEKLEDFEVVSIGERSAVLASGSVRVAFELPSGD